MMTACLALFSLDPSRRPNVGAGVAQILYQHEVDVPEGAGQADGPRTHLGREMMRAWQPSWTR